jgi:hypothetical protein
MSSPARTTVVDQLEREWPPLLHHRLASDFSRWRSAQPSLRRFEQPSQLLCFLHTAPSAATDEPLLALLILAQGDAAAGRFVLQAVLPALKAQAQRLTWRGVPHDELWELLLFYAWQAIRTYPVARRSRTVAANLVLQVLHDTTRELDAPPASRTRVELVQPRIVPGRPPLRTAVGRAARRPAAPSLSLRRFARM